MNNKIVMMIVNKPSVIFILKTGDESDYWYWEVDVSDIESYFKTSIDNITTDMAVKFCNDEDNATLGCSGSPYDHVEDVLNELEIDQVYTK